MVHYLHPLDQVVSIEEVEILNDLKVLLSSFLIGNVYALINHWVLQDEVVEETKEKDLVILHWVPLLPHIITMRVI